MASSVERLHFYRLFYHELSAAQSRIPPGELAHREARLRQAELRMLEELIMLFVDINPNPTTTSIITKEIIPDNAKPGLDMDSIDISLVTDILLLSPPSPWIVYLVDKSTIEWRLCYVSPSMKRLLGWRPSDLVGKPIWEGCHKEDVAMLQQILHAKAPTSSSPCPSASNSLWTARSHNFGDYINLRRLRRDQSIASMHGTGIAIGSRWYVWVEQDTSNLKLALVGSSGAAAMTSDWPLSNPEKVLAIDGKSCKKKGFQPPTILVEEERVVELNPDEAHSSPRKGNMREIETPPGIRPLSPSARSKEVKIRKASFANSSRHSTAESLPVHSDMSPPVLANQGQRFKDTNDKGLDLIRGKNVLLVDDSNTYLKGGQALLAKLGCRVFLAHDGEDALQMMQHVSPLPDLPAQFDMIFMDLSMPKMDGIQAVKLFRIWEGNQQSGRAHTLIIAVTANDTDGDMVLCAQTGFDGFVTKPLTKKKILDCLAASTP